MVQNKRNSDDDDVDDNMAPVVTGWHDVKFHMKIGVLVCPSGRMTKLSLTEILHTCAFVQRKHSNLYDRGTGDMQPCIIKYKKHFTSGLNTLPVFY
jgi:hypothetical protein